MRSAVIAVLLMWVPVSARAQEWVDFASVEDGFRIAFPAQPEVSVVPYTSQYGYALPAKVYSVTKGPQRFSVTVVDFRGIQQLAIAKVCPKGPETCRRGGLTPIIGEGEWRNDIRGAMLYSLNSYLARGSAITNITGDWQDLVEGMMVQLTNADRSRTYASISMHDNRLYIVDGTAPAVGYPPPIAFQQNFSVVDGQGRPIRYQRMYSNRFHGLAEYPVPPRVEQPQ